MFLGRREVLKRKYQVFDLGFGARVGLWRERPPITSKEGAIVHERRSVPRVEMSSMGTSTRRNLRSDP